MHARTDLVLYLALFCLTSPPVFGFRLVMVESAELQVAVGSSW